MFAEVHSLGVHALDGFCVRVEADISAGLPQFCVVGLPDNAVKESSERVHSAIKNLGFTYPVSRITVNLAPADIRKTGPVYDLPIFLALLCADGQLSSIPGNYAFIGELSLDGAVRGVSGVLPMAMAAKDAGIEHLFVPAENAAEAAVIDSLCVYAVSDAMEVEIAAAGGHNLLLIGPPGTGKSMLAKRMPGILPRMTREQAMETSRIYSVAGMLPKGCGLLSHRPFRSPHHSVSATALAGGGSIPRPGEVSLAHHGVLFLDELPEFSRLALEILRQPLEDGKVTISRVSGSASFPCEIMLVAAMNPCPCGYYGHPTRQCTCSQHAIDRYLQRVSGPLLDRIDLHVEVAPVGYEELSGTEQSESSAAILSRVQKARGLQEARYQGLGFACNARLSSSALREYCRLAPEAEAMFRRVFDNMALSARAYDRILKVSRTIADLAGSDRIETEHLSEAIQYRTLDRKYWF